jgi:uncharacterized protein YwqG
MSDLPPDVAARLERSRQDAIRAKREGVLLTRRPLRPGEEPRSYIGGLPRLREDLDWPVNTTTGLPLSFIAQVDLRDVPRPRGIFFPAEGVLWFFADFYDRFPGGEQTRVLFDPHPHTTARERESPANLPPLDRYDHYGWRNAQHPRAFVEPQTALLFDLFDTFYDVPYTPPTSWEDALLRWFRPREEREEELHELKSFGAGVYSGMINKLREEAVHRALGPRQRHQGCWYLPKTGFGEPHWPATSIDAEYALMNLANRHQFSTGRKNDPGLPEAVTDLAARLQDEMRMLRSLGSRPLAPAERVRINALIEKVRRWFARFDLSRHPVSRNGMRDVVRSSRSHVRFVITTSYPHAAFEILRTMPEAETYVPAELQLDPYQEWTAGGQLYWQMFGHGSSPQDAPQRYQDHVLLLQITGSPTLGFCFNAVMHYWILKRDLARGRFDRVEATFEEG